MEVDTNSNIDILSIAVIGMSLRFPGAKNTEEFWSNLINGVESIRYFTDEELIKEGVDQSILKDPNYVKAAPILENVEYFDASFFNFSPGEANILDPQRRIFLECGWEAFEDAGYDPANYEGAIGVYAGAGINMYLLNNLISNKEILKSAGEQQILISSDKDHLPTHLSYKLNLTGPSINVNTACSSSLVAIHLARQSLLLGECDMAIAGGSTVIVPNKSGYFHVEDSILSSDGHCRAFDADGDGTIWGSGCGIVLLKRLEDAIADGDNIHAIIKGSAINNDGSQKVGFTAPSIEGQVEVVAQALASAGLNTTDIGYIEAHGTGTKLGDPIEIAALNEVFTDDRKILGKCAIGSVKTNIGHLGAAAGVAGLIKTVLSLENEMIPPSLNFSTPNSKIDFEKSNFYVNNKNTEWKYSNNVRYAGISSLAVGGTNAHIILGEAPRLTNSNTDNEFEKQVIVISARTPQALDVAVSQLADYLEVHNNISLKDVAFTLQLGRRAFQYRKAVISSTIQEAIIMLRSNDPNKLLYSESIENDVNLNCFNSPKEKLMIRWLRGEVVDWSALAPDDCKRVSLPTYPFEKSKYWIEPTKSVNTQEDLLKKKKSDMSDWYYEASFKRSSLPRIKANEEKKQMHLVFVDECNIANQVMENLKKIGDQVVVISKGEEYQKIDNYNFIINPSNPSDYNSICESLKESRNIPDSILHFYSVTNDDLESEEVSIDSLKKYQEEGFYSILYLVQAFNSEVINNTMKFMVFTNDLHDITGFEKLRPEKGSVMGQCKVIQQEFLNITCRTVDFIIPTSGSKDEIKLIDNLMNEIKTDSSNLVVAYRDEKRWIQTYEPLHIEDDESSHYVIKEGGVYLVYDGLVGIGLEVAKYMMKEKSATVFVLADAYFPQDTEWDTYLEEDDPRNDITIKIKGVKELIDMGAIYLGPIPLVENKKEIEELIDNAEKLYGKINGVLHCAGGSVDGHVRPINFSYHEVVERDFTSIPYTLIVLNEIFENKDIDFRLVMSSLGSILGGILFISYSAASCLGIGYINKINKTSLKPWIIQCWDSWTIEWGIVDYKNTVLHSKLVDNLKNIAIDLEEGLHCFERSLTIREKTQIAICCTDLNARYNKWVKMEGSHELQIDDKENKTRHKRPNLETEYAEPITSLEKNLAEIFGELLDIEGVGRYDNFFDMGGHSLLATQLNTMLREQLNIDLPINIFFENPTAESLATVIEEQ